MSRRRKRLPKEPALARIESLSHDGRGVAHIENKTTFIDGTLPDEEVVFRYHRRHARYDEGNVVEVINPSPERITAHCEYFGYCGGCSLQHIEPMFQVRHKQDVLLEQLHHIGGVSPQQVLQPLTGTVWGYRRKARLGVKYVEQKGKVLVGFREKFSPFIADIKHCGVLHPAVGEILADLQILVSQLSIYKQLPQIEVAVTDKITALVVRHLVPLTENDRMILRQFESEHNINFYLQPGGLDSVVPLSEDKVIPLSYCLPDQSIEYIYWPTDFIQINNDINIKTVNCALELLELNSQDYVLDLFCGIGNFSLAMACQSGHVIGVEGDTKLIDRARFNAQHNGIKNAEFILANLSGNAQKGELIQYNYQKILIDPPRTGALEIVKNFDFDHVQKLVYVSCNPATLARDAGILVNEKGFNLHKTGVMDMFPHTAHIESIALFVR